MINRQSFLLGALAGAATTAFAVYPLPLHPAIGVIVACVWGLLALPAVLQVTAAVLIQRGQETTHGAPDYPNMMREAQETMRYPGGAPAYREAAEDDIVDDQPDSADDPPGRVTFESSAKAPPGWTNMASMFGGWPQPGQPPQPPQPPRHRPPENRQNGHTASQPPAQPVAQPPDNQSRNWLQDLADYPGLQGDPGPDPADRPVPWLNTQPLAIDDADDDPDSDAPVAEQVIGPMLPRRAPTADEYPLIWTVLSDRSMNAAIATLWGSKDGKTHAWATRVAAYYADYSHIPIWIYEMLGTHDRPEDVRQRLAMDPLPAMHIAEQLASCCIIQCDHCGNWQDLDPDDYEAGLTTCHTCRES